LKKDLAFIFKRNTVLAFFLVVAISQIFPLWLANLLKKINLQICMLKKKIFNLHQTYQERRRDGPYDVLATLKMQGAKSHSIMEEDERNSKIPHPNLSYKVV
jgi:hypothetical protein